MFCDLSQITTVYCPHSVGLNCTVPFPTSSSTVGLVVINSEVKGQQPWTRTAWGPKNIIFFLNSQSDQKSYKAGDHMGHTDTPEAYVHTYKDESQSARDNGQIRDSRSEIRDLRFEVRHSKFEFWDLWLEIQYPRSADRRNTACLAWRVSGRRSTRNISQHDFPFQFHFLLLLLPVHSLQFSPLRSTALPLL